MSCLNRFKQVVYVINFFLALFSFVLMFIGVVMIIQFHKSYFSTYFLTIGIVLLLYGICISVLCAIDNNAVYAIAFKKGCWSGKKMIAIAQIFTIAFFLFEIYTLYNMNSVYNGFNKVVDNIDSSSVPYEAQFSVKPADKESIISTVFNSVFFYLADHCEGQVGYFWSWVNKHCPEDISSQKCMGCYDYLITYCLASSYSCEVTGADGVTTSSCPYAICRRPALFYFSEKILKWSLLLGAGMALLHILCVIFNFILLCWEVHDKAFIRVVPFKDDKVAQSEEENEAADNFDSEWLSPGIDDKETHQESKPSYLRGGEDSPMF